MAEDPPDFDNERDFGAAGPPLPPEDRLWRHPSELSPAGALGEWRTRRGGSNSSPHRAGALSAGFVGAMLAAGLVLVGSHFANSVADQGSATGAENGPAAADHSPSSAAGVSTDASVTTDTTDGGGLSPQLRLMVQRVGAATVSIESEGAEGMIRGNGLVIGKDGVVLTSAALVDGSTTLNVWLSDGTPELATFVGSDPSTGVAVLRLPSTGLSTIPSDATDHPAMHDMVALVSSTDTRTSVVFSSVQALDETYTSPTGPALMDEIATEVVPDSDPLGSAVIDRGDVIGVVVASDGTQSLATPMWLAVSVANELAATGTVVHGWLGVNGIDDDASGVPDGVRVLGVNSKSAAEAAGVEPGDVIEAVNGASVATVSVLQAHLYCLQPGARVRLTMLRGKREQTAQAVLNVAPAA